MHIVALDISGLVEAHGSGVRTFSILGPPESTPPHDDSLGLDVLLGHDSKHANPLMQRHLHPCGHDLQWFESLLPEHVVAFQTLLGKTCLGVKKRDGVCAWIGDHGLGQVQAG